MPARPGWVSFRSRPRVKGQIETDPARGRLFVLPGGYRLLVGRDMSDAAAFRDRVKTTLLGRRWRRSASGSGGAAMTRNMLRRVEPVNRTSERIMPGDLSQRVPVAAAATSSISSPPTSTPCSTRSSG